MDDQNRRGNAASESSPNWVHWHAFVETRSPERAADIVRRIVDAVGFELETLSIGPYWKDPDLMDVRLQSQLVTDAAEDALAHIEEAMSRLTTRWISSPPQRNTEDRWDVEVLATSDFVVAGLTWLDVEASNHLPPFGAT